MESEDDFKQNSNVPLDSVTDSSSQRTKEIDENRGNIGALEETIITNSLSESEANEELLHAIEPSRSCTENTSSLSQLDDILKDIDEMRSLDISYDMNQSFISPFTNETLENSDQLPCNFISHQQGFDLTDSQGGGGDSVFMDGGGGMAAIQQEYGFVEGCNQVISPTGQFFQHQCPPAPPPTPRTPGGMFQSFNPTAGIHEEAIYLNFNLDSTDTSIQSDKFCIPYPTKLSRNFMPTNFFNPNNYSQIMSPPPPPLPLPPMQNFIGNYPRFFFPRPRFNLKMRNSGPFSQYRSKGAGFANKKSSEWENSVPKKKFLTSDMIIVQAPLKTRKTLTEFERKKLELNLDLSSAFDTSNIVIPMIKEIPRDGNRKQKRKQELKNISGADNFAFEEIDKVKKRQNTIAKKFENVGGGGDSILKGTEYSDEELPEINEIFKKKRKTKNENVKTKHEVASAREYYNTPRRLCQIKSNLDEDSSESDSDDIPIISMKSLKCLKCKKIFKTSRSLSIHRKRCNVVAVSSEDTITTNSKIQSTVEFLESENESGQIAAFLQEIKTDSKINANRKEDNEAKLKTVKKDDEITTKGKSLDSEEKIPPTRRHTRSQTVSADKRNKNSNFKGKKSRKNQNLTNNTKKKL